MRRGWLAALLLAATQAWGAEVFVCKPDQAIGFVYDEAARQWQARVFADPGRGWVVRAVTEDERRVMGLAPQAFVVQIEGQAQIEHICRDGFTMHGDLRCERERVSSFEMGNKTLRYLYVRRDGYWTHFGQPPGQQAPVGMEIGRCRPL